jgi:hypothetical protein
MTKVLPKPRFPRDHYEGDALDLSEDVSAAYSDDYREEQASWVTALKERVGIADDFDPAKHPRFEAGTSLGGKFAPKGGGTGFVPTGPESKFFAVSKTEVEHLKRVVKVLEGKAQKGANYRHRLRLFSEEAKYLHGKGLIGSETTVKNTLALRAKTGESFWVEAQEAFAQNKTTLYIKLMNKAKELGFDGSSKAPPPDNPWANLNQVEKDVVMKQWLKYNPGKDSNDFDLLPSDEKWSLHNFVKQQKPSTLEDPVEPAGDPETKWNTLSSATKDLAKAKYIDSGVTDYYNSLVEQWHLVQRGASRGRTGYVYRKHKS